MANQTTATKRAPAKKAAAAPAKASPAKKAPAARKALSAVPDRPAQTSTLPPPGWYVDPAAEHTKRYWDGEGWFGDSLTLDAPTPAGPLAPKASIPTQPAPAGVGQAPADGAPEVDLQFVVFGDRRIRTRPLDVDLVTVWNRIARRMSKPEALTAENIGDTLDRALKMIQSIMADEADRDWLEDQLLEGTMTLQQASSIISKAVEQFLQGRQQQADQTAARATKAASKARRKR